MFRARFAPIVISGLFFATVSLAGAQTISNTDNPAVDNLTTANAIQASNTAAQSSKISVGVIRWDYWYGGSAIGPYLVAHSPAAWNYRQPFFYSDTEKRWLGEDPAVATQEIELAKSAGIDYFIFQYFHDRKFTDNAAIQDCKNDVDPVLARKAMDNYLVSPSRSQVNFAIMIAP